jgi:hypothetical protein
MRLVKISLDTGKAEKVQVGDNPLLGIQLLDVR